MRPPFSLAGPLVNRDTVELLEELLSQARRGELLGIANVAIFKRRKFEITTTGEATRSPIFTSGAVGKLWFDLAMRVNREAREK